MDPLELSEIGRTGLKVSRLGAAAWQSDGRPPQKSPMKP